MSETQPKKLAAGHPKPQKSKQPQARPVQQRRPAKEEEEYDESHGKNQLLSMAPSWLFSFVFHLLLILGLAFWFLPLLPDKPVVFESGMESGAMNDSLDIDFDNDLLSDQEQELDTEAMESETQELITEVTTIVDLPQAEISDIGTEFNAEEMASITEAVVIDTGKGGELSGRGKDARKQLAKANGASGESEEAVDLALLWIVKHQLPNGSWSFDHTAGQGNFRKTSNPGIFAGAKIAATSMALLPLLGAGHTHVSGEHKEAVKKGFEFLKRAGKRRNKDMISYYEPGGRLYSHGLATIALCECYGMTYDKELEPYAQGAIKFTEYAQDPKRGGWQYEPRRGGDTSAVGWQLMALKSAKISQLKTNRKTFRLANTFLDRVSDSRGADYGYETKPRVQFRPTLTSIGLLCRMYLGWKQDRAGLVDGMERIAELGPDTEYGINMYYNYYATQAMSHMYRGKPEWNRWNVEMRDFLVEAQSSDGSWSYAANNPQQVDRWSPAGGRLYDTSLSCMTLEVYYRFLPIYDSKATDDDYQLWQGPE